jgi:hypothetical protein
MKFCAIVLGEHIMHDGNLEIAMKCGSGNGALLDNQTKGALKILMYAMKLNTSLKSSEQERNQICIQLCEVQSMGRPNRAK